MNRKKIIIILVVAFFLNLLNMALYIKIFLEIEPIENIVFSILLISVGFVIWVCSATYYKWLPKLKNAQAVEGEQ